MIEGTRREFTKRLALLSAAPAFVNSSQAQGPDCSAASNCSTTPIDPKLCVVVDTASATPVDLSRPFAPRMSVAEMQATPTAQNAFLTAVSELPAAVMNRLAGMHCAYCGHLFGVPDLHASWAFLPWHRALLLFYERLLSNTPTARRTGIPIRVPYWNWEDPSQRTIPPIYSAANSPLCHKLRCPGPPLTDSDVGLQLLATADPVTFYGTATAPSITAGDPHKRVHSWVRGDMGSLNVAAYDHLFFAHHANIDRMWLSWARVHGVNNVPPGFADQVLYFLDENGQARKVTAGQLLDPSACGYEYSTLVPAPMPAVTIAPVEVTSGMRNSLTALAAGQGRALHMSFLYREPPAEAEPVHYRLLLKNPHHGPDLVLPPPIVVLGHAGMAHSAQGEPTIARCVRDVTRLAPQLASLRGKLHFGLERMNADGSPAGRPVSLEVRDLRLQMTR